MIMKGLAVLVATFMSCAVCQDPVGDHDLPVDGVKYRSNLITKGQVELSCVSFSTQSQSSLLWPSP
jgi:hypothetical protein